MKTILSDRLLWVKPSPILVASARAAALKATGKDIISLTVGEPDFDTPDYIKKAAIQAIEQGFTKYTAVEGILELRQAICAKFARDNQLQYEPQQILVSNGAKQSFYNLAQVLLNPGDEVIIPSPYWASYPDIILLTGATPVIVFADHTQHFKMTAEQLKQAITPKTKLIVLNSPSNPTGMAYTASEWQALAAVLQKHPNIYIAIDDMYEHIYWGQKPFSNILMCCPDLYDRTVVLHGVSKTYAMTGFRIGFAAGPKMLIDAMITLQSQCTSNACSISQKAATAALNGDQSCVHNMVKAFKERHDYLVTALNTLPGVECTPNDGTFYLLPRVQGLIDLLAQKTLPGDIQVQDDVTLAEFLLMEANVATVPGIAFGAPGYLRLSFATKFDNLHESVSRIRGCLNRILT